MNNTMQKKSLDLCLQILNPRENLPNKAQLSSWVLETLNRCHMQAPYALTIRMVSTSEIQTLNKNYRKQNKPTNILSFEDEDIPGFPKQSLGELVVCPVIIEQQAHTENKPLLYHWAHIIIHGTLHLIGFTHDTDLEATKMETLEKSVLQVLF